MDDDLGGLRDLRESAGATPEMTRAMGDELRRVRMEMRETGREAGVLAGAISGALRGAFDKMVMGGGRASDMLRAMGREMAGRTFDAAMSPIHGAVSQGLGGLIGAGIGALSGSVAAFAKGGVLSAGSAQAFAQGGVVDGPTLFGMRGGLGLMGEAGPEAILPLRRGADGKLGVAAAGGGGARVTINISTPDLASFEKSRGQVAAELARAVRLGSRRG